MMVITTAQCGGDWQAAIDLAFSLGVKIVTPTEDYAATAQTGPLKMRPGIVLHNFAGNVKITMEAGAELANLIDFYTYSANHAEIHGVIIDGNRANNTDDLLGKHLVSIYDASDVKIRHCKIRGSNGTGIYVGNGSRAVLNGNEISDVYTIPVIASASVKANYSHKITNNRIYGEWGQHAIVVKGCGLTTVKGNVIFGQCTRGFNVQILSGNNVVSNINTFTPQSVGKFLIFKEGVEALITGYASPGLVYCNLNIPNPGAVPAVWGNGDVISIESSDYCDVRENTVIGGASLGISVFSNGTWSAVLNSVQDNTVINQGSAGISIQNVGSTCVLATLISGNKVVDCGLNGAAADNRYNVGIAVRGGAGTRRVSVANNIIEGFQPTMDYGIAFDAAVSGKVHGGNSINGTIGNKQIHLG